MKSKVKEKCWEQPEKNDTLPIREKQLGREQTSHQKPWRPEEGAQYFSSVERKKLWTYNFIFIRKTFFRNEWKIKTFSRERKPRQFVISSSTLKEWLQEFLKHKGNNKRRNYRTLGRKKEQQKKQGPNQCGSVGCTLSWMGTFERQWWMFLSYINVSFPFFLPPFASP